MLGLVASLGLGGWEAVATSSPSDELLLSRGQTDARVLTEQYVNVVEPEPADICLVKLVQRFAAWPARGDPEAPEVVSQLEPVFPKPHSFGCIGCLSTICQKVVDAAGHRSNRYESGKSRTR
jgi:hypothetical protein